MFSFEEYLNKKTRRIKGMVILEVFQWIVFAKEISRGAATFEDAFILQALHKITQVECQIVRSASNGL